jgi:hypothetical protein
MEGVVVDFYTLYDPLALAGTILTYTPFYNTIYVSRHSLWLEATSHSGGSWVPISGFKFVEDGLDFWGIEWLRNWSKRNLSVSEDTLVKENLYASIMLIQESMKTGIVKILQDDDKFLQIGGKILKDKDLSTGILYDSMMSFGEGKENGFYLSPDIGHGFQLGVGIVLGGGDKFRFSTSNGAIKESLAYLFSPEILKKRIETKRNLKFNFDVKCGQKLVVKDVFKILEEKRKIFEVVHFLEDLEQSEKNIIYFAPKTSVKRVTDNLILSVELDCQVIKFAD